MNNKAGDTYPPNITLEAAVDLLSRFESLREIPDHSFRLISAILRRDQRSMAEVCRLIKEKFGPENLILVIKSVREKLSACASK